MTTLALRPTVTSNAYWDAVKDHARPGGYSWSKGYEVGGAPDYDKWAKRWDFTSEYSWTITDPATVQFVATHTGPYVFDPFAGTGWWAHLLGQYGISVLASDLKPLAPGSTNTYHWGTGTWAPVRNADAVDAAQQWGWGRTLLLSWPPYDEPIGAAVLAAYPGDRVVYIGENDGGCCGDDAMHALLRNGWIEVACHQPVQWWGMHDFVTVYERAVRPAIGGAR